MFRRMSIQVLVLISRSKCGASSKSVNSMLQHQTVARKRRKTSEIVWVRNNKVHFFSHTDNTQQQEMELQHNYLGYGHTFRGISKGDRGLLLLTIALMF